MKACVKATGEIVEVNQCAIIHDDGTREIMRGTELDEVQGAPDYWARLEHQYAGMAMQGLCANYTEFTKDNDGTLSNTEMITENARIIAHALVEKYKKEERK